MAEKSGIAWTRSTFNPWIGCTKVGPGCDHCYASVSTPARSMKINWGPGEPRRRTSPSNWKLPLRWNQQAIEEFNKDICWHGSAGPIGIGKPFWPVFCSSLADVFDNEVPDEWRAELFELILATPYLTWLLLTKRIGNAERMMRDATAAIRASDPGRSILHNVWIGATVVNQEEADRDIPKLLQTPAHKRFISYEPALGPVNWSWWLPIKNTRGKEQDPWCGGTCLDWIIVGGESDQPGMKARPFYIEHARSTVEQCKAAGVACFVKQLGSAPTWNIYQEPLKLKDRAGADPAEWPEDLRVQEFPR